MLSLCLVCVVRVVCVSCVANLNLKLVCCAVSCKIGKGRDVARLVPTIPKNHRLALRLLHAQEIRQGRWPRPKDAETVCEQDKKERHIWKCNVKCDRQ